MVKECCSCKVRFEITDKDQGFYTNTSVPAPTHCPNCRMQRRTAFRNERNLYKRKCDFSGKEIISVYPPDSPYTIYNQKVWWSDNWDPIDYGQDFDFSRPFFRQFYELSLRVPRINLQNDNCENSEYCNDCSGSRNCYLCFNSGRASDAHYCTSFGMNSNDCMDMFWSLTCELCYECSKMQNAYHCLWCFDCKNVSDCYFSEDLRGCKNCFGCVGLRQKKYYLYNEYVGREQYEEFLKHFSFTRENIKAAQQKVYELRLQTPRQNLDMLGSEDCLGDDLWNSKNCVECFGLVNSENNKYIWDGIVNNSYDCFNVGVDTNFVYECIGTYRCNNVKFSNKCSSSSDLMYCDFCMNSEYLFGCIGLNHKKYCILNKQYTKEEYDALVPKIIEHMKATGEWGEFFPMSISPFGYNDTMAQEYFPLDRDEALAKECHWNDYVRPRPEGLKYIAAKDLPDDITEIPDDICNWVLECSRDGIFFKITPWELKLYRREGISLPELCPNCRHFTRKAKINPRKLHDRSCMKCNAEIKTTYAESRPEIVYCEKCYLESVN